MPYEEENYEQVAKEHEGIPVVGDQPIEEDEHKCSEEIFELKWRALVFICFLTFGGYYIYDFPGSLGIGRTDSIESWFAEKGKDFSSEMNQALYSIYSWPNTICATIGGLLIDNFIGLRKSLMLFVILDAIGATIFYFGVLGTNYPVMMLGRFVFGLGNESLSVAQQSFVARYFRGKWGMALAFGIVISFSRVGSSFNFLFSPRLASGINVQTAVLFGVFACLLSVGAAIVLILLDLYAEKKKIVAVETVKKDESGKGGFSFKDFKALNREFIAIAVICIAVYCAVFPFVGIGKPFFEVKYDIDSTTAGTYLSVFQFACAGFSPFSGGIVDAIGRTCYWLIGAASGFTLVHILFLVITPNAYAMTIFMGIVYSVLAASLWPAVPFVVAPSSIGLAYGAMNSMQNAGLAIYPLISGAILDAETPAKPPLEGLCINWTHSHYNKSMIPDIFPNGSLINCTNNTDQPLPYLSGFNHDELLFMGTAAVGIVAAVVLMIFNKANDGVLLANNADRKVIFAAKMARWKREEAERTGEAGAADVEDEDSQKQPAPQPTSSGNNLADEKTGLLQGGSSRTSSASMTRYDQ